MASNREEPVSYSQFACVGTGFSAIGLGATLKRWYNIEDIAFFEQHSTLGGTWAINKYPGASIHSSSALTFGLPSCWAAFPPLSPQC